MGLLCCMTGGSELDVTFEGNFYTKHEGLVRFRHNFFLSSAFNRVEHCPVIIKFFLCYHCNATVQRVVYFSRSYFLLPGATKANQRKKVTLLNLWPYTHTFRLLKKIRVGIISLHLIFYGMEAKMERRT